MLTLEKQENRPLDGTVFAHLSAVYLDANTPRLERGEWTRLHQDAVFCMGFDYGRARLTNQNAASVREKQSAEAQAKEHARVSRNYHNMENQMIIAQGLERKATAMMAAYARAWERLMVAGARPDVEAVAFAVVHGVKDALVLLAAHVGEVREAEEQRAWCSVIEVLFTRFHSLQVLVVLFSNFGKAGQVRVARGGVPPQGAQGAGQRPGPPRREGVPAAVRAGARAHGEAGQVGAG